MNEKKITENSVIEYRPLPENINLIKLLFYMLGCLRISDILIILFATAMITLVGTLYPMASNLLYNQILPAHKNELLLSVFLIFIGIVVVGALFSVIKNILLSGIRIRMSVMTEAAFFGRCLSLPVGFYRENPPAQVSEWMNEIPSFCKNFSDLIFGTWFTSLFALLYLIQIGYYVPSMLPFSVIIIASLFAICFIIAMLQSKWTKKRLVSTSVMTQTLYDLFYGVEKIKLNDAKEQAYKIWEDSYRDVSRYTYAPPVPVRLGTVLPMMISSAACVTALIVAGRSGLSAGEYMVFNAAFGMILGAAVSAGQTANIIASVKPEYELLNTILKTKPEYMGKSDSSENTEELNIEVKDVSFSYSSGKKILDNLSLTIPQGDYVAIVGRTGCGKSTLLRLLLGFETPDSGEVLYNGTNLMDHNLMDIRGNIGVVLQNDRLFPGSILENMKMANPDVTDEEIWEALKVAGMEEDVKKMPMQLHTHIGERSYFSGGQNQRLQIARAIMGKPKLLIMDEATSALDNETQAGIAAALDAMDCTRIVVAHRLSTIKNAKRILVLDGGHIVEDGDYETLMQNKNFFYELVCRQLGSADV